MLFHPSSLPAEVDPIGGHPKQPRVSITNLSNGSRASSPLPVQVSAEATDPSYPVSNVAIFVDGGYWARVSTPPYSFLLHLTTGTHSILARGYEAVRDEYGLSYLVNVAVNQAVPPAPPPGNWQKTSVADGTSRLTALAIDAAGAQHAAYILGEKLYYGKRSGGVWQSELILNDATPVTKITLTVDGAGAPHIAYVGNYPFVRRLHYMSKGTAGWTSQEVSSGTINNASIAVDPSNGVKIAYTTNESFASELMYASKSGNNWNQVLIDSHGWVFDNPSLSIGKTGQIKMIFTVKDHHAPNSTELRLIEWEGYWKISHVLTSIPGGTVTAAVLAVDGAGNPKVAFVSGDGNLGYTYKYDNGNNNNWAMEVVDSPVGAAGLSLAVTAANAPYISYYSASRLKFARRTGSFWYSEELDAGAGTCALKLDGSDNPVILYESAGIKLAEASSITVNQPPSLSILAPQSGPALSGTAVLYGTASDDIALSRVEIQVDDRAWQAASGSSNWSFSWDTRAVPDGPHVVSARATDSAGSQTTSSVQVTVKNTPSLVISSVSVSNVGSSSVTVRWNTSNPGDSRVEYGLTADYGSFYDLNTGSVTVHSGVLSGLSGRTTYHFRVHSLDSYGQTAASGDNSFLTAASPEPDPPLLALSISGITDVTCSTAVIRWTASEGAAPSVEFGTATSYGRTLNLEAGSSGAGTLGPLCPNMVYHVRLKANDSKGRTIYSERATFKTPRETILNLEVQDGLVLSWDYRREPTFSHYLLLRSTASYPDESGGMVLYSGLEARFQDVNAVDGTRYFYAVYAKNEMGGISAAGRISCLKDGSAAWKVINSDQEEGVRVRNNNRIAIPPRCLPEETEVSLIETSPSPEAEKKLREAGYRLVGKVLEFGPDGFQFGNPARISLSYDPAEIAGADENELAVAFWDPSNRNWQILGPVELDKANHLVSVGASHFSAYAVVTKVPFTNPVPESSYVYPNPAKENSPVKIHVEAAQADLIRLRVYNEMGGKIREGDIYRKVPGESKSIYECVLETSDLPAGTYLYTIEILKAGAEPVKIKKRFALIK